MPRNQRQRPRPGLRTPPQAGHLRRLDHPKLKNGDTEWIPPAHLDHGRPRTNTFFHPEKLLRDDQDDDEP
jgi:hypothetical protein